MTGRSSKRNKIIINEEEIKGAGQYFLKQMFEHNRPEPTQTHNETGLKGRNHNKIY